MHGALRRDRRRSDGLDELAAAVARQRADLEPDRQRRLERLDMGDEPYQRAASAEAVEDLDRLVERVRVERAETLVDEECAGGGTLAGGTDDIGPAEGERKRGEERLTARQRSGGSGAPGVAVVHEEVEARLLALVGDVVVDYERCAMLRFRDEAAERLRKEQEPEKDKKKKKKKKSKKKKEKKEKKKEEKQEL